MCRGVCVCVCVRERESFDQSETEQSYSNRGSSIQLQSHAPGFHYTPVYTQTHTLKGRQTVCLSLSPSFCVVCSWSQRCINGSTFPLAFSHCRPLTKRRIHTKMHTHTYSDTHSAGALHLSLYKSVGHSKRLQSDSEQFSFPNAQVQYMHTHTSTGSKCSNQCLPFGFSYTVGRKLPKGAHRCLLEST